MKRLLLTCLLTGLASVACAQSLVGATYQPADQSASDSSDATNKRPFCVEETGTRVHHHTNHASTGDRATNCATSMPGRTYTRSDLDRSGEVDLASALHKLDPSIH